MRGSKLIVRVWLLVVLACLRSSGDHNNGRAVCFINCSCSPMYDVDLEREGHISMILSQIHTVSWFDKEGENKSFVRYNVCGSGKQS